MVPAGVGLFESCGKISSILVDFLAENQYTMADPELNLPELYRMQRNTIIGPNKTKQNVIKQNILLKALYKCFTVP